jgi:hypothetical protein
LSLNISSYLGLAFLLLFFSLVILFIFLGRKQNTYLLRELPGFVRLRRLIGLTVEAGKRLHVSIGRGGIMGVPGAAALVGLTVLDRIARAASMSDRPPVATSGESVVNILSQDTLRSAYHSVNAQGQYNPASGRLSGLTPFSYAAGAQPVIHDEQVAANILVGHMGSEAILLLEAGAQSGSTTLAGTDNLAAQAIYFGAAQDVLIGEEFYAAGAYLDAGPVHIACLRAQDFLRWVLVAVMILGSIIKLLGLS